MRKLFKTTDIRGDGVKLRLYGIDAPERSTVWQKPDRYSSNLPLVAKMKEYDEDRYGRLTLSYLLRTIRASAAMICSGRWYEYYALIDLNLSNVRDAQSMAFGRTRPYGAMGVEEGDSLLANPQH